MSLRAGSIEEMATLPDGRQALVRVGVPADDYIATRELETVAAELIVDGQVAASVNTMLRPEQDSEARQLVREIAAGLGSGELEPTAGAIEPLVLRLT